MPCHREEVHAQFLDIGGDLPHGLRRVRVERDACLPGDGGDPGIGSIVPTSLLACITVIRIVLGVIAFRTSSGSTIPYRSTGRTVTFAPSFPGNGRG